MSESPFTSGGKLATPPSRAPEPPPAPAPQPAQPPAVAGVLQGHVIGKFSDRPLCTVHFPGRAELARLAYQARTGNPAPFVGTGHEYTALTCACLGPGDDPWKLGDHMGRLAASCMRGDHERCLDMSCECDCGPHDSRAAAAAVADNQLAAALKEISAAFAQNAGTGNAELLELVRTQQEAITTLTAKVAALEPAGADKPKTAARTSGKSADA